VPTNFALSSLINCPSGSADAVTATGNQYARYYIVRPTITDPGTTKQLTVRAAMTAAAVDWNNLPLATKDRWDRYADQVLMPGHCGSKIRLTGRTHFCRSVIVQRLYRPTMQLGPPGPFTQASFSPVVIRYFAGVLPQPQVRVTYNPLDGWATEVGGMFTIAYTNPVPLALNAWYGPYANRVAIHGIAGIPSGTFFFKPGFNIANNQRVFFLVRAVRADARISSRFRPKTVRV